MSGPKKIKNLTDTYDDSIGITTIIKTSYSLSDLDKLTSTHQFTFKRDPVAPHNKDASKPIKEPVVEEKPKRSEPIEPTVSVRLALEAPPYAGYAGAKFIVPDSLKLKKYKEDMRKKLKDTFDVCEYEVVRMDSPIITDNITELGIQSPDVSKARVVVPDDPSYFRKSVMHLPVPRMSHLELIKPRSGIFVNVAKFRASQVSGEDDELPNPPRGRKKKKKQPPPEPEPDKLEEEMAYFDRYYPEIDGEDNLQYDFPKVEMEDQSTHMSDNVVLGKYGVILSNASSATSMHEHEKAPYEDVSWCDIPLVSKLVQTLREAQLNKRKKRYKKGSLENHSFTKLRQKILDDFCYKCTSGSIHQGDLTFTTVSRNRQGICMPVTAFCYAALYKPRSWTQRNVDEIVEMGNILYLESIAELHMHREKKEVTVIELQKHVIIHDKKVKFDISEPEVKGLLRSMDKRITNLSCGLRLFFLKYNACLLRTDEMNVLIWKPKRRHFYFFDATPRKNNLYQDPNGTAVFTYMQKLTAVTSVLLDRTNLGNCPFSLCHIRVLQIMGKDEKDKPPYITEDNTYNMLNERQAVVQASYDLGDICFSFSRNKQALSISLIALAYSRISPPNMWHRKTLDKIMIIGNQLHKLCIEQDCCTEVTLENLPAVFTVGPYILEMHLYPNRFADLMYKKSVCQFQECLKLFFEKNASAIAQIGKSYLAIWQQRGMYFTFDPYTRNKEGLKCRSGTACVTMNKDVDTLAETVVQNFENREAIFYLHVMKLLRITRDPHLSKIFPRHMTLSDFCPDTFVKHKIRKSHLKAIDKPVTANFTQHALKKLLAGAEPDPSVIDIGSNIMSLGSYMMPAYFETKLAMTPEPKKIKPDEGRTVDLDSPSLSDTQIAPKRPLPYEPEEDIPIDDLDSYELTQEEKELEEAPEGEAEGRVIHLGAKGAEEEGSESTISRFGVAMSQVTSGELDPCYTVHYMNTELTYCYKILPARELAVKTPQDRFLNIDEDDQSEELKKLRKFRNVREGVQILMARTNALLVGEGYDINLVVPYMCIMASAFALEVPLHKWDARTIDFVLKAGIVLYNDHEENFIRIDDFKFELMNNNLFATVNVIFNTYIGEGLYETFAGQQALEKFLEYHVFNRQDCGFVVMPHYACAVFYKRYLFYLFEPFNCDKQGVVQLNDEPGQACLMRFKSLDALISHLVNNLSSRVQENDKTDLEFRLFTLAKPVFTTTDPKLEKVDESVMDEATLLQRTQSGELKRASNFVDLPDGSQLIRGHIRIDEFGPEVEYMAPYICIMASAVAEKFGVRTWSGDVVDFIMKSGEALYKKTRYRFSQLAKLDIPKVSLGKTDFRIEVKYIFDAPMKMSVMKSSIKKVVSAEREWAIITTEVYSCAVFQRNGLIYLFDPFPCNELGLDDGLGGVACVARFLSFNDLCIRILFNKNKREAPEKVDYTRFILSVCRASGDVGALLKPQPRKVPHIKTGTSDDEEEEEEKEGGMDELEEGEEEGEGGTKARKPKGKEMEEEIESPNKIGYQQFGKYQVLEGTRSLPRPEPDQTELGPDHFVSLIACLTIISKPLAKWDTKTVDRVVNLGERVYDHADDLSVSRKRTIKNILIGKHFFDVIIRILTIEDYKNNKNFEMGINYVMRKRKFCIVQFPQGTYVIYMDRDNDLVHLFHPYVFTSKTKNDESLEANACWIQFKNPRACRNFLKMSNDLNSYTFYTFNVVNVTKAPKSYIITHQIEEYIRMKQLKGESYGKPFHEHQSWMDVHQNPWGRISDEAGCGTKRTADNKWFNWDIEYNNDLFSLMGTIHQTSKEFRSLSRGKQSLSNAIVAIGMSGIYDLKEWNTQVVDAVVRQGNEYFLQCIKDIKDENHELGMDDLKEDCQIYPYRFKIHHQPIVDGTMFLTYSRKYNLYRALRYFFDEYYYRAGVIIATKNKVKRIVSFAKRRDTEYYMFDSQAFGLPMFAERRGVAYILKCTTLARLVHVLVLTLRGGDFFIYEVIADSYLPMKEEEAGQPNE